MSGRDAREAKINLAVETCMAYTRADEYGPIRRVTRFLHLLGASPDWSDSEIRDVTKQY